MRSDDLKKIESFFGYPLKDRALFEEALCHMSYTNEKGLDVSNERLEFLGDAVIGLVVSSFLYETFPSDDEGQMSHKKAVLVCEKALAEWALEIGLDKFLRIGKGLEKEGGRNNYSVLSDAMEALIGAYFLDGGYETAHKIVRQYCEKKKTELEQRIYDANLELKKVLLDKGEMIYELVKTEGPPHRPLHWVRILLNGEVIGQGQGRSIKEAKRKAAEDALKNMQPLA
jgi:ribonuclease-3